MKGPAFTSLHPSSDGTEDNHSFYPWLKRAMDISVSCFLLIALSPLMLIVAVLVKLSSSGPTLYRRISLGRSKTIFAAYKFRTMEVNADSILRSRPALYREFLRTFKLEDDPRVTKLGRVLRKTSIDELPELINVLKGEMSLVGPRPIAPDERKRYGECYEKMLTVRPGLTGLWQANGRQSTSYEERVCLDMYYVEHCSLLLDLKILVRTVPAVLKMTGAV